MLAGFEHGFLCVLSSMPVKDGVPLVWYGVLFWESLMMSLSALIGRSHLELFIRHFVCLLLTENKLCLSVFWFRACFVVKPIQYGLFRGWEGFLEGLYYSCSATLCTTIRLTTKANFGRHLFFRRAMYRFWCLDYALIDCSFGLYLANFFS